MPASIPNHTSSTTPSDPGSSRFGSRSCRGCRTTRKSSPSARCGTTWLTNSFTGPKRFEIEGADAARAFAREQGLDDRRLQLIWDSVALNSTPSIGLYKEAEVALCTAGIGVEFGFQYDRIPPNEMQGILAAFPRLEMKRRFTDSVCRIVKTRPETTYDNFAGDFGQRFVPGYQRPSTVDFLMNAPFEE